MAATRHQILHVAMVVSLSEYNSGTIHKLPVLSLYYDSAEKYKKCVRQ